MNIFAFFLNNYGRLLLLLGQHLEIVGLTVGISICFAFPVGYFLSRSKLATSLVVGLFSAIYSIPALAMFSFLLPVTGLGMWTAVTGISIYTQFLLLRGTIAAFHSVDRNVLEAAKGMGLGRSEILFTIQLPLAAPVFLSSLRLAVIASIGITVIAAAINSGGLGVLMFEGIRNLYMAKIFWGIILSCALSLLANKLFGSLEAYFSRKAKGQRSKKSERRALKKSRSVSEA